MPLFPRRTGALAAATSVAFALSAGSAAAAPEPVLYGAAGGGGGGGGGGSTPTLYRVDPATAATTAVGPTGFQLTGLAVDPTSGVMYGSTGSNDADAPSSIVTVDKATGAGTVVGPVGDPGDSAVADIAFLASGELVGWSENSDTFVRIDKETGRATIIGEGRGSNGDGMSVDGDGRIFAMLTGNATDDGDLFEVDPSTGEATVVAPLSGSYNDSAAIPAAAFACDRRTLFAVDGLNDSAAPDYLATVNTTTGEMTPVGATRVRLNALEWDCPVELAVSSPSTTVSEGAGLATVTVTRTGGTKGPVTVDYATGNGSAVAGQDYVATSGTLTVEDSEASATFTVPLLGDGADEPDEAFTVDLSNAKGASLGAMSQTVTIADDDAAPAAAPPATVNPPPVLTPVSLARRVPTLTSGTTPARDRTRPYRFVTTGRVRLTAGVSPAAGCTGKVRVTIKSGSLTISSRQVSVSRTCGYRSAVAFRVPRRLPNPSLKVVTRFAGNAVLFPARASVKTVRVR